MKQGEKCPNLSKNIPPTLQFWKLLLEKKSFFTPFLKADFIQLAGIKKCVYSEGIFGKGEFNLATMSVVFVVWISLMLLFGVTLLFWGVKEVTSHTVQWL